jgi:hypothetical protein
MVASEQRQAQGLAGRDAVDLVQRFADPDHGDVACRRRKHRPGEWQARLPDGGARSRAPAVATFGRCGSMVSEACALCSIRANGASGRVSAASRSCGKGVDLLRRYSGAGKTSSSQWSTATRKLDTMITMLAVSAKLTIRPLAATCAISGACATFWMAIRCGAGKLRRANPPNTRSA